MTSAEAPLGGDRSRRTDVAGILRRRWLVILLPILVCVGVAVARRETATKTYDATASVSFSESDNLAQTVLQLGGVGTVDPQRFAATQVLVAKSPAVAAAAARQLGGQTTGSELLHLINVQAAANADVLQITASTQSPRYSARVANAFATQYNNFTAQSKVAAINAAQKQLRGQLLALEPGSAAAGALRNSLERLTELRAVAGAGTSFIGRASPPTSQSGIGLTTSAVLGLLIGVAIAFSLVAFLESRDRRVRSMEEFDLYGLPVFATVPKRIFRSPRILEDPNELEPFRIARTALDFVAAARRLSILVVTSAVGEEGKTTVAIGLAHAFAASGRRVALVELDLRRPTFARYFSLHPRVGVTAALLNHSPVEDLLLDAAPNLSVLPSGQLPPNPAELLGSSAVTALLAQLTAFERLVIIDSPPLIPVADGHAIIANPLVTASLVVARLGLTTIDQIRRTRSLLERQPAEPVGLVVTGVSPAAGAYGYGYGPSYSPIEPSISKRRARADADLAPSQAPAQRA